jgi:diphthamide biosynthesis methyltransferase
MDKSNHDQQTHGLIKNTLKLTEDELELYAKNSYLQINEAVAILLGIHPKNEHEFFDKNKVLLEGVREGKYMLWYCLKRR